MQASTDPWAATSEEPRGDSRGRRPRGRGRGRRGRAPRPQADASQPPAFPTAQETETVPTRARGGRTFRRGRRPEASGEIVKTDPVFVQTSDLSPEERGLNLNLVVCGPAVLIKHLRYGDGREEKEWSVEAGDTTGTINVRVTDAAVAGVLREGVSIVVRNAFVEMVERKHMQLATDSFGKVEIANTPHTFHPDTHTKHSDTEYEKQ